MFFLHGDLDPDWRPRPTAPRLRIVAFLVGAAALPGAEGGCGSNGSTGAVGEVGTYTPGAFTGGDASVSGLDAHIEENHVSVSFVTLSCADRCADVVAVASGGQPPYTYAWDDGSTSASRTVCPTANTNYELTVTDTATTGELTTPAETVHVPLTANVIACPDSGGAPPPLPDASRPWTGCEMASGMGEGCILDGGAFADWQVSLTQPLVAGSSYEFTMQVTTSVPTASNYQIEVDSSNDESGTCGLAESLALLPFPVANLVGGTTPIQFCATATADATHLLIALRYTAPGGIGTSGATVQTCAVTSCADGGP
jgi:SprB repeat